jgi:hypothetical protein
MDNIVKRIIEEKLSILIRQPLIDIGRASNLLWLSFGERISTLDRKGNEIQKGKYALNVQCAWRLTQNNQIIVASKDFYIPKTGLEYNLFDWEEYGNNRFDERIGSFKPMITTTNLSVINISVDNIGGFKIDLDLGIKFEIFPDDSLEDEFWRLIINGDKSEHFVFIDKEE